MPQAESMTSSNVARIVPRAARRRTPSPRRARRRTPVSAERSRRVRSWRNASESNERSIGAPNRGGLGARSPPGERRDIGRRGCVEPPSTSPASLPSRRKTTRSAIAAAAGSCVTITIVRPSAWLSSRRTRSTSRPDLESRFPVGSSARTISGERSRARAIDTRCCCPPESSAGVWSTRSPRPTRSSSARARSHRSVVGASRSRRQVTFSSAVSEGSRLKNWKMNPMWSRRSSGELRRPARRNAGRRR